MSLPKGPVAGGYVSFAITYEQFTADLATGGSYKALTLTAAQALRAADPPGVVPGTLYGITGNWNATGTDTTVYVHGVRSTAYHQLGIVYDAQGAAQLVQVDVMAGTYKKLSGGEELLAKDNRWSGTNTYEKGLFLSALGGAPDLALMRSSAGVLEVNTGVAGSPATLSAMNYVAQAAAPAYNSFTKLVTKMIAAEARLGATTAADPATPLSKLGYLIVGPNPARRNVALAPLDPSTTLLDSHYYNVFGFGIQNVAMGAGAFANTFGSIQNNHILGSTFEQNIFGADVDNVRFGNNCRYNTLGSNITIVRAGNYCEANILASSVNNVLLGDNVKACRVGPGCSNVSLLAGCERVELYNCTGTASSPFTIAAGSKDQVWRNNVLQVGGSPGTSYDDTALKASIYGRFAIGGFKGLTAYKAGDEIIRPDGLARVAAKKDFTTTSTYVAADWLVTDAVLSLQQAAPLQFPILLYDNAGGVTGYTDIDVALAQSSGKVLYLPGQPVFTVTTENARGPLAIVSNGGKLLIKNDTNFRLNASCKIYGTTVDFATAGGNATIEVVGGSGAAATSAGAVQLVDSTIYPTITLSNSALRLHTNSVVANVVGNGTAYLFDSSSVTAHAAGVTIVAASAGSAATLLTGAYPAPTAGAQTIAQAGATAFFDVGIRTAGGKSIPLDPGTGYTVAAGQLSILAAAGVQSGDVVTYAYATGAVQAGGTSYTAGSGIDITGTVISTKTVLRPALRVSNGVLYPNATAQPAPTGQFLKVTGFTQVEREVGSTAGTGWDAANQQYIVPVSGEYQVAAVGQLQPGVSSPSAVFYHIVYVNDVRTRDLFIQACPSNQEYYGGAGTTDLSLDAGDRVDIRYYHSGGEGSQLIQSNVRCAFSIRQLPS